jgi:hypothetical protein
MVCCGSFGFVCTDVGGNFGNYDNRSYATHCPSNLDDEVFHSRCSRAVRVYSRLCCDGLFERKCVPPSCAGEPYLLHVTGVQWLSQKPTGRAVF